MTLATKAGDEESSSPSISLRAVRPLALLSVATAALAGALIPALHGWVVGMSRLVDGAGLVGDAASQAASLFLLFGLGAMVVEMARSRAGLLQKGLTLLLGSLVSMAMLTTMALERVPLLLHAILLGASAALAVACGASALLHRAIAGAVPVLVGVASLARGSGAYLAELALRDRRDLEEMSAAMSHARWLATSSAALVVIGSGVAGYFLFRSEGRRGLLGLAGAAVASVFIAWRASAPVDPEEAAWSVLVRRTGQELLTLPTPHLPPFVAALCVALPLATALVVVLLSREQAVVGASLALALIAGDSAEVPLLALALAVGAIALAVDRRDGHGVRAALAAAERRRAGAAKSAQSDVVAAPSLD